MKKVIVYTDGGSRGNPGEAGLGVYITDAEGDMLKEVSKYLGIKTNNHAEYEAVLTALKTLRDMFGDETMNIEFDLRLDSELVQRQMTGVYRVRSPELKPQFLEIQDLRSAYFPKLTFTHVRREYNKEADRLANVAMDRGV